MVKYVEGRKDLEKFDPVTGVMVQDEFGREVLDNTPMAPPIGYKKQPSMVEIVRDMVRSERLRVEAAEMGRESFEDADDFDIPDDPVDPSSPFENDFDPPVKELLQAGNEVVKEKSKKKVASPVKSDSVVPDVNRYPQEKKDGDVQD